MRIAQIARKTKETKIALTINLDGSGKANITTGIGFFDHMLVAFATHSGFDITLEAVGDLNVDCHHTVEDVGIVLGKAIAQALADKKGITRFAHCFLPMDEAMAFAAIDISGRGYCLFNAHYSFKNCAEYENDSTAEFMRALATNAAVTLHVGCLYGENDHHINEALFKSVARVFRVATQISGGEIPSTKGAL
ncbi:MAG: imidazoleglycerol-phosphate dehydratase HisB [Christensenellaceae bacterium]|jgi:imidazoleglycerol-phosphate dehydratase|nr:imidazoleglycerol-phosphate dehydratase HisB [Christensenellaceae bacterium]